MFIRETFINETEGYSFGSSDWHETFTDDLGRLYRDLKAEYGNARNIYRDGPDGRPVKVGWVFTGRSRYEDTHEPYIRSVWVEVSLTRPIRRTITGNVTNPWDKAALPCPAEAMGGAA